MSHSDSGATAASVLQSMTLLATLSTAETVRRSVDERRSGRDPAAQEPAPQAAHALRESGNEALDLLMQLMLGHMHIAHQDEQPIAVAVRHFDLLMKLRRVERLLHSMHQRLLSLYPDVSDALVEEARASHNAIESLLDASEEELFEQLDIVTEQSMSFVVWARHEV